MNYLKIPFSMKHAPKLDPGFIPFGLWRKAYLEGAHRPFSIAVEREGGKISVLHTFLRGEEFAEANYRYAERTVKFLLWSVGGFRVYLSGDEDVIRRICAAYTPAGERAFDVQFMQNVYERPFEIHAVSAEDLPEANESAVPAGGHMDGCRIGFDAGGSDRKVSAVIDGKPAEYSIIIGRELPVFYKNARIFCNDFTFRMGAFSVVDDKFDQVPADAIDLGGATVIPGLIDVHSHGNSGADFSDGDYEGLKAMAAYYAKVGVTSFAPASMTLPYEVLEKAFANARQLADEAPQGLSVLRGIQMEGPYFSYKKRGAQNADYLKDPDFEGFQALQEGCGGLVRIVDIAPELPGAAEFVAKAKALCTVSVAHTDSDYDHAKAAFDVGATHLTHLFNAMPGIHHRNPGVIPAAAENKNVRVELICDGLHVHPASVRLAFSLFGGERMVLISDSGRCCGMPDGSKFELGGQDAWLREGVARLADGTIACSATNLYDCMVNAIRFGIAEEDAVRAASYNPACAIGADTQVGSIEPGKQADFLVCSGDYTMRRVFLAGKELF